MTPPVVTITEVIPAEAEACKLRSLQLDSPRAGHTDTYAIELSGWVMGDRLRPVKLAMEGRDIPRRDIPLGLPRPDLGELYPDIPWASSSSGFQTSISVLGFPTEFTLTLFVVFEDGDQAAFATVQGRHGVPLVDASELQPLMITTLGRTGSTWVTQLLGRHPSILTYPPFKHEVRVSSYWLEVLLALSEPASYLQSVQAMVSHNDWWLGRGRVYDEATADAELLRWLDRDHVEHLVEFCKGRVRDFYARVAESQPNKQPRYFAEKALPSPANRFIALRGLYTDAREVFLVRDFRDVLCSIIAFNKKRRYHFFNRNLASSDEDYVRNHLGPDVQYLVDGWRIRSKDAHLLRYEDLVLRPVETVDRLLRYLGLDSDERIITEMLAPEPGEAEAQSRVDHQTAASPAESVGRWWKDLSPEMADVCNEVFAEALEEFGYSGSAKTAAERAPSASPEHVCRLASGTQRTTSEASESRKPRMDRTGG